MAHVKTPTKEHGKAGKPVQRLGVPIRNKMLTVPLRNKMLAVPCRSQVMQLSKEQITLRLEGGVASKEVRSK